MHDLGKHKVDVSHHSRVESTPPHVRKLQHPKGKIEKLLEERMEQRSRTRHSKLVTYHHTTTPTIAFRKSTRATVHAQLHHTIAAKLHQTTDTNLQKTVKKTEREHEDLDTSE